jgi:hypothetical protein
MPWSKIGAHLLLQTRTKTRDGTLRDLFTQWYPAMATNDNAMAVPGAAACSSPRLCHAPTPNPRCRPGPLSHFD